MVIQVELRDLAELKCFISDERMFTRDGRLEAVDLLLEFNCWTLSGR